MALIDGAIAMLHLEDCIGKNPYHVGDVPRMQFDAACTLGGGNMDPAEVQRRMAEARIHLGCVCQLARIQH